MLLGYFDAMRMLYGLEGRIYYLDAPEGEEYYFARLMAEAGQLTKNSRPLRCYTEEIFPETAAKLGLKAGWDYKELYLALLEERAKKCRLSRFAIYTPNQLLEAVNRFGPAETLDSEPEAR